MAAGRPGLNSSVRLGKCFAVLPKHLAVGTVAYGQEKDCQEGVSEEAYREQFEIRGPGVRSKERGSGQEDDRRGEAQGSPEDVST